MNKTPEEIRNNLCDLKINPMRDTGIVIVTADSPSADFARDFANALAEEYVKYFSEQRAAGAVLFQNRNVSVLESAIVRQVPPPWYLR